MRAGPSDTSVFMPMASNCLNASLHPSCADPCPLDRASGCCTEEDAPAVGRERVCAAARPSRAVFCLHSQHAWQGSSDYILNPKERSHAMLAERALGAMACFVCCTTPCAQHGSSLLVVPAPACFSDTEPPITTAHRIGSAT